MLRFTTEIANRGDGPLEVVPSAQSSGCDGNGGPTDDRDATQRIFADTNADGVYERGGDGVYSERRVGCMRYHAAHRHWHVLEVASYELRREGGGRRVAGARKVGFCLSDDRLVAAGPSTPPAVTYPFGPPGSRGCDAIATEGISVGWSDLYVFALPGQQLDVTGLSRGRYCLTMRADPRERLEESRDDNNVRRVRIALDPARLRARPLRGACRI